MMGYLEFALIGLLAFILIGPRDFPKLMFSLGDMWRRVKTKGESLYSYLEDLSEDEEFADDHRTRKK